jgi:hemerythrin superfamily protein
MADVITLIEQDHREVERVFGELQSGRRDRRALLTELETLLLPHTEAEEQAVYPTMERADLESFDRAEADGEHAEAAQLLERLKTEADGDTSFRSTLSELVEAVQHHIEEEEQEMLPELRQQTDEETLSRLGARFEQAKTGFLASVITARTDTGGDMLISRDGGGSNDLLDLTKEELYERAKELDVDGRSKMNKQELARAISSSR